MHFKIEYCRDMCKAIFIDFICATRVGPSTFKKYLKLLYITFDFMSRVCVQSQHIAVWSSFRLVRNLSEGFKEGFPTRFACGNDSLFETSTFILTKYPSCDIIKFFGTCPCNSIFRMNISLHGFLLS